ncbi:tetraspanin-18-like [Anticarsia gemmatalis]|uniref:tetraspanin-18-like n=1 Tax=Anticarsia gemmatalis TaxID=129554 RepID=UPI003F7731D0
MCLRFLMKYILFFVNLVFVLAGLALIGVGVAAIYKLEDLLNLIPISIVKFAPYVFIILGAIIFLIAFSGCCGAITESKCLLITYAVFMAVLAGAKIFFTIELHNNMEYLRTEVEGYVNKAFDDPSMNATFHAVEVLLKCCGTTGPGVYNMTIFDTQYVPPTCCENPDETTICLKENAFQIGCTTLIGDLLESLGGNLSYTLIFIIVAEVLAMLFAIYVSCTIKEK